ncbi:hypothetical protein AVEN_236494-1 [Araneus ventricosus]|uniref:SOCS box domain-containing protein n=1 Tax=Araneus ventricosus TaxID=182803 RepID=A0A4Y2NTZ6_ARAVE|nr:hypothetical protein AVEN_236494-1 [Araneus ventricosus]
MLQIIWMHIDCRQHHCIEAASEALRLICCSIPDAYISFKEIKRAFRGIFRAEELKNIYGFYAKAVGEFFDSVQLRSLQHLCRSIMRSTVRGNQIWIPESLRQTSLPKSIESFLNLEKVQALRPDGHRFETRFHRRSSVDVNLVDVESDFRCQRPSWCGVEF